MEGKRLRRVVRALDQHRTHQVGDGQVLSARRKAVDPPTAAARGETVTRSESEARSTVTTAVISLVMLGDRLGADAPGARRAPRRPHPRGRRPRRRSTASPHRLERSRHRGRDGCRERDREGDDGEQGPALHRRGTARRRPLRPGPSTAELQQLETAGTPRREAAPGRGRRAPGHRVAEGVDHADHAVTSAPGVRGRRKDSRRGVAPCAPTPGSRIGDRGSRRRASETPRGYVAPTTAPTLDRPLRRRAALPTPCTSSARYCHSGRPSERARS